MQEVNVACNPLMYGFVDNYMEKIFYFSLKKTGNFTEAEDLTQDIALNVFLALRKGVIPHAFSAWVWQIARNRYAMWAREKHDRRESVSDSDIWNCEVEDETYSIADEMTHAEQMALLRRELAFIKSDYRNIVVAYYIENKSIREIASVVSLSECAIQQRLHRARKLLKEGMDMAREFGIRSYRPEEVVFVKNGRNGEKGQPWTIVSHLLYKNIFLEVYENPETAEEIAIALGIALPYMEDELNFLLYEQLLRKEGNRYCTNFCIVSREQQRKTFEASKKIQMPLTEKLCTLIDLYIANGGVRANIGYVGYENAKWALLVRIFDVLQCLAFVFKNPNTLSFLLSWRKKHLPKQRTLGFSCGISRSVGPSIHNSQCNGTILFSY